MRVSGSSHTTMAIHAVHCRTWDVTRFPARNVPAMTITKSCRPYFRFLSATTLGGLAIGWGIGKLYLGEWGERVRLHPYRSFSTIFNTADDDESSDRAIRY